MWVETKLERGWFTYLLRDNIEVEKLQTPFAEGTIESTGIKIGKLTFINIYRPPSGDRDLFVDYLMQYIDTLRGQEIIIGGDFNLNRFHFTRRN